MLRSGNTGTLINVRQIQRNSRVPGRKGTVCYKINADRPSALPQYASSIMAKVSGFSSVPCAVLNAIMLGFCGFAAMISTLGGRIKRFAERHAWLHGMASIGVPLGFYIVILDTMLLTIGHNQHCPGRIRIRMILSFMNAKTTS